MSKNGSKKKLRAMFKPKRKNRRRNTQEIQQRNQDEAIDKINYNIRETENTRANHEMIENEQEVDGENIRWTQQTRRAMNNRRT